jgi:hypothetical protein
VLCRSGGVLTASQNSRNFSTRFSGGLPAINAPALGKLFADGAIPEVVTAKLCTIDPDRTISNYRVGAFDALHYMSAATWSLPSSSFVQIWRRLSGGTPVQVSTGSLAFSEWRVA